MTACQWCEGPCTASPATNRRFCSNACRNAFHGALRSYAASMFDMGALEIEQLRAHVERSGPSQTTYLTDDSPHA